MKKVLSTTKLSTPSKLVRKVLSRSSDTNKSVDNVSTAPTTSSTSKLSRGAVSSSALESELSSLKEQMAILQMAVNNMHQEAEQKDKALISLEKEKKELCVHLKREKRSSTTLKKQLQDEREFYYKEKEQYCQEMNDCKKLKKKLSKTLSNRREVDSTEKILECKSRMAKLQDALNETLEVNYNLSVKFLKMKNTKSCLKKRLKEHDLEHKRAMENLIVKVNDIKNSLAEVVDKRFTLPISSSNKQYLAVIKKNGVLMYENLCLQMEIDNLQDQIDELKFIQFKKESKRKFKRLQKDEATQTDMQLRERTRTKHKAKSKKQSLVSVEEKKTEAVIKVFEKEIKDGVPHIIMLPEDLPGIEFYDSNTRNAVKEPINVKINAESVSQISTLVHCSSTQSTLRAQSSPDIIMSSMFGSKLKL